MSQTQPQYKYHRHRRVVRCMILDVTMTTGEEADCAYIDILTY